MTILNCSNSVCKRLTIPANNVDVPNITVTLDVPTDLVIATVGVNYGSVSGNIWSIPVLPLNQMGTLDICFSAADCNIPPTSKCITAIIATSLTEGNYTNNEVEIKLDYVNCTEVKGCVVEANGSVGTHSDVILPATPTDGQILVWRDEVASFVLEDPVVSPPSSFFDNGDGTVTHDNGVDPPVIVDKANLVDNGDDTFTFDNNNGTPVVLPIAKYYSFDQTHLDQDGLIDFRDNNGTVVDQINLCNPNCPPITVSAADVDLSDVTCLKPVTYDLSVWATPCSKGHSIWKILPVSVVGGTATLAQNGELTFMFDDCSSGNVGSFVYQVCCEDGVCDNGVVTLTPIVAAASGTDDSYAFPATQTLTGDVSTNDIPCSVSGGVQPTTTYALATPPSSGVITMTTSGKFAYNSSGSSPTADSFTYNILCNGVISATNTVNIQSIVADANDDFFVGVKDIPFSGDVSINDLGCLPGISTTTYQWKSTTGVFGGTLTGTPDNFTYTPPSGFCGADAAEYELLCDGVVYGDATGYFNVSCGLAVSFPGTMDSDTTKNFQVAGNGSQCSNGGQTTYHLVADDTIDGVTNTPTTECGTTTAVTDINITNWVQSTGTATVVSANGASGEVCVDYFIRCTAPDGSSYDTPPASITIQVIPSVPVATISSAHPNVAADTMTLTLGGFSEKGGATLPLTAGDTYRLSSPELGLDVELIVGQDIATGFQNDNGTYLWADFVQTTGFSGFVITPANFLTGQTLTFDKWEVAKDADVWGDGTINGNIGTDWNFNGGVQYTLSGTTSIGATTIIPKLYGSSIYGLRFLGGFSPNRYAGALFASAHNTSTTSTESLTTFNTRITSTERRRGVTGLWESEAAGAVTAHPTIVGIGYPTADTASMPPDVYGFRGILEPDPLLSSNVTMPSVLSENISYSGATTNSLSSFRIDILSGNPVALDRTSLNLPFREYFQNNQGSSFAPANISGFNSASWYIGTNPGDDATNVATRTLMYQELTYTSHNFDFKPFTYQVPVEGVYNIRCELDFDVQPEVLRSDHVLAVYSY